MNIYKNKELLNRKVKYGLMYNIQKHEYLVTDDKIMELLEYLNNNAIKNNGAYVLFDIDVYNIVVYTNSIHDKIIRKNYAFA